MNDLLPERPVSEDVVEENDDEANEDTIRRSIFAGCSAPKGYCNDSLCKIQEEVLCRNPKPQPNHKNTGIGEDDGKKRGCPAGALKDVGEGRECGESGERSSSLRRDKGERCEEKLYNCEEGRRELKEDDEDGEDVPQRTGRENGGGDCEHIVPVVGRCGSAFIGIGPTRGAWEGVVVEGAIGIVEPVGLRAIEKDVGSGGPLLVD